MPKYEIIQIHIYLELQQLTDLINKCYSHHRFSLKSLKTPASLEEKMVKNNTESTVP